MLHLTNNIQLADCTLPTLTCDLLHFASSCAFSITVSKTHRVKKIFAKKNFSQGFVKKVKDGAQHTLVTSESELSIISAV